MGLRLVALRAAGAPLQSHDVFERLSHKKSKVCKAVVSLNAFNGRQNWHLKVIDMFDLAFDRAGSNEWQTHNIFDSSFNLRQRRNQS